MIVDHRTYELQPGRLRDFLALYEKEGLPVQKKHLGNLIGFFTHRGRQRERDRAYLGLRRSRRPHQAPRGDGRRPRMAGLFAEEPRIHEAHEQQDIGANVVLTHEVRENHDDVASAPQRRAGPDRSAAHSRDRHDLRRPRRELPRGTRRALCPAQLDPLRHLPPGGRRGQHGGSLRQAHRQARHLLRHPRPGRDQCQHRFAYRLPGFDAHDPARRAGRARGHRPRGVPGNRLSPHVRPDGQVGRPDRGRPPHSRTGEPGIPHAR